MAVAELMTATKTSGNPEGPGRLGRRWAQGIVGLSIARLVFIAFIVCGWQVGVDTGTLPETSIPRATDTARALGKLASSSAAWHALGQTLTGWGIGLLLCVAVAVPLGLLIGLSPFLARSTRLVIDFLQTIPAVALIPVLLLVLGSTMNMKLVLIVFGSLWPLLTSTISGVRHVDPVAHETVRSFRLNRTDRVLRLVLPTALPFMLTGIRISAVLALVLATAGEFLGQAPGIGNELGQAQSAGAVDIMFAWLIVAGALGVALNVVFMRLDRRILPWAPANREPEAS
jgi:ABC-type nitrate/sulfonate/bicarbonate transport system permease component